MSRVGWVFLTMILIVVGGFLSMTRFGSGPERPIRAPAAAAAVASAQGQDLLTVPVAGVARSALTDSWGDARDGGGRAHHGIDIMAARGTRVLAAADGTVEKLFESAKGGTTLYVRTTDGRWVHYYAHLAGYAPGMREGLRVRAGDTIAFVGDTGNAGAGNYHLHFGVQRMRPGESWSQGEDVNPFPMLAGRRPGS